MPGKRRFEYVDGSLLGKIDHAGRAVVSCCLPPIVRAQLQGCCPQMGHAPIATQVVAHRRVQKSHSSSTLASRVAVYFVLT